MPDRESGLVQGNVRRLTHNFIALSVWRSWTVRILASASAMTVTGSRIAPKAAQSGLVPAVSLGMCQKGCTSQDRMAPRY